MSSPPAAAATGDRQLLEILAAVRRLALGRSSFVTDVLAGGYRSTFRGVGVEFEEVREYSEGDDPRYVDWNVTARAGRPFVKRFVEEREHTIIFVLDGSGSMRAGLGAWSPIGAAARLCAMLGLLAIDNNDRVGLIAGGELRDRYVPPRKGARHVLSVVRDVLHHRASGPGRLDRLLGEVARRVRRRAVVFLLSDFQQLEYGRVLDVCGRRHDLIAVRLIAPEQHDPPDAMLRGRDPEAGGGRIVDFGDPRVRAQWSQRCAQLQERTAARLRQARAERIDVAIPYEPDLAVIAAPLQRFFRQRMQRERYR